MKQSSVMTLVVGLAAEVMMIAMGCGPYRPPTFQASGEVVFKGKPLAGAGVMFCPTDGRPAAAATDSNGRFTLRTWTEADGAIEGEHVVCINKFVPESAGSGNDLFPLGKNVVPEKYVSPRTSPLRVTITRKGPNEFLFELEE